MKRLIVNYPFLTGVFVGMAILGLALLCRLSTAAGFYALIFYNLGTGIGYITGRRKYGHY